MEAQKVMVPATGHRAGLGSQPGPLSHSPNYQGINSLMLSSLMPLNLMCPLKYPCLHFSTGKLLFILRCPLDVTCLGLLPRQTPPESSLFLGLPTQAPGKRLSQFCPLGLLLFMSIPFLSPSSLCFQTESSAWLILQIGDHRSGIAAREAVPGPDSCLGF